MSKRIPLFVDAPNMESLLKNVLITSIRDQDVFTHKIITFFNNELRYRDSQFRLDGYSRVSNAREYVNGEFCPTFFSEYQNSDPPVPEKILACVREKSVYVIATADLHLAGLTNLANAQQIVMRSAITARAAKNAGARRVTLVLPLMPYARQDPELCNFGNKYIGQSDSLNLSLEFYKTAGVDEVMTFFPHSETLNSLCERNKLCLSVLPHIPLIAHYVLNAANWNVQFDGANLVFAGPDKGSWPTVEALLQIPGLSQASALFYNKFRATPNDPTKVVTTPDHYSKNFTTLTNKTLVFVDDMLDTCGTMYAAGRCVLEQGVRLHDKEVSKPKDIVIFAGHPVFTGIGYVSAQQRLHFPGVREVIFTNTCPTFEGDNLIGELRRVASVLRLASYFQNAILAREQEKDLSSTFSVNAMLSNQEGFGYLYDVRRSQLKE